MKISVANTVFLLAHHFWTHTNHIQNYNKIIIALLVHNYQRNMTYKNGGNMLKIEKQKYAIINI